MPISAKKNEKQRWKKKERCSRQRPEIQSEYWLCEGLAPDNTYIIAFCIPEEDTFTWWVNKFPRKKKNAGGKNWLGGLRFSYILLFYKPICHSQYVCCLWRGQWPIFISQAAHITAVRCVNICNYKTCLIYQVLYKKHFNLSHIGDIWVR